MSDPIFNAAGLEALLNNWTDISPLGTYQIALLSGPDPFDWDADGAWLTGNEATFSGYARKNLAGFSGSIDGDHRYTRQYLALTWRNLSGGTVTLTGWCIVSGSTPLAGETWDTPVTLTPFQDFDFTPFTSLINENPT